MIKKSYKILFIIISFTFASLSMQQEETDIQDFAESIWINKYNIVSVIKEVNAKPEPLRILIKKELISQASNTFLNHINSKKLLWNLNILYNNMSLEEIILFISFQKLKLQEKAYDELLYIPELRQIIANSKYRKNIEEYFGFSFTEENGIVCVSAYIK